MTHSLFNAPAGGSLQDKVNQALRFAQGARGTQAAAPPDAVEEVRALAAEAVDAAPAGGAGAVATEVAAPVAATEAPDLAAAARAAAQQSLADPAFAGAAQQQVDVVVQPRLIVQGQSGPTIIPVDVAVPAAHTNVTISPATAVVVDPATGRAVTTQAAHLADSVPTVAGGGGTASVDGLRGKLAEALAAARGTTAAAEVPAALVTEAAPAAARPGLLDRVRASGPSLQDLATLARRGGAPQVGDGAAATVATAAASGRGASLLDQLREAAQVAQRVNPKG